MKNTKVIKVKISHPGPFDDTEIVEINVPTGLTEEEEDNFIDDYIENNHKTTF